MNLNIYKFDGLIPFTMQEDVLEGGNASCLLEYTSEVYGTILFINVHPLFLNGTEDGIVMARHAFLATLEEEYMPLKGFTDREAAIEDYLAQTAFMLSAMESSH